MTTIKKFAAALGIALTVCSAYFFVPPPQHARAQFADQGSWAGTAGGTANALILTLNNVASLNDIVGVPVRFNPASNNTLPVTIEITGAAGTTSPIALLRPSSIGLVALSLNELWAGETTSVTYNGTNFILSSNVDMRPIGDTLEFRGSTAPRGALIEDGSCYSQTTYAALFSVIGTTYNSLAPVGCSGSQFAVPDSRGTMFAALDNQGANGAANRITSGGSSCTATAVGLCGGQSQTLTIPQLPVVTPSGTIANGSASIASFFAGGGSSGAVGSGATGFTTQSPAITLGTFTFTGTSFGSGNAHPILNPVLLGRRAIKY